MSSSRAHVFGHRRSDRRLWAAVTLSFSVLMTVMAVPPATAAARPPGPPGRGPTPAVTVNSSGSWRISTPTPSWTFGGNVGAPVSDVRATAGHDAIGSYKQVAFSYQDGGSRHADIRVYNRTPIVLFTINYLTASPNVAPFPAISTNPRLPYNESFVGPTTKVYSGCAHARFNTTANLDGSPLLSFDAKDNSFIISAASNYEITNTTVNSSGTITSGIMPQISTLPAGFTHTTILGYGKGINSTYSTWGKALTSLTGKKRPANDQNLYLNKIGYWTDHGSAYYYRWDASQGGYEGTLDAVKNSWAKKGLPLDYMQLDGWYYPKGPDASWSDNSPGIYQYEADPQLFPNGLASFQRKLGLPLAVQAKFVDPSSPYHTQYAMSGDVITDP